MERCNVGKQKQQTMEDSNNDINNRLHKPGELSGHHDKKGNNNQTNEQNTTVDPDVAPTSSASLDHTDNGSIEKKLDINTSNIPSPQATVTSAV